MANMTTTALKTQLNQSTVPSQTVMHRLVDRGMDTYTDVQAILDTTDTFDAGDKIRTKDGYLYQVAASGASDHHISTAGGVKLYVMPGFDGYYPVGAFGFKGDGSAGDLSRLQAASDATPYLLFQSKTYQFGEYNTISSPWFDRHKRSCIRLTNAAHWRTTGKTTLQITSALQTAAASDPGGDMQNDIALVFGVGSEVSGAGNTPTFSAPGFTFVENAGAQGFGAGLALYGFDEVDLDGTSFNLCNPVRIGGDTVQQTGVLKGSPTLTNMTGTFGVGGKPGGITEMRMGDIYVEHGRGGVNIECEDVGDSVDESAYTHEMRQCVINSVTGYDLDDTHYTGATTSPVEFCKIADGAKRVSIDTINLYNAESPGTARASALNIKPGQTDSPVDFVNVGRINGKNIRQGVYAEVISDSILGYIQVGQIHADDIGVLVDVRNTGEDAGGYVRSVNIGQVGGTVQDWVSAATGDAFSVDTNPSAAANNAYDPILRHFYIGGGHLRSVRKRTFHIRGVERFECYNLAVDEHEATSVTGGYAGSVAYNVIEADHIVLDGVTLAGFGGTPGPIELRPKLSCKLHNFDVIANGAGSAVFFNGSGAVEWIGGRAAGATNAWNFRDMTDTFDASSAVNTGTDRITISGHVFRHGEKVRYTEGTGAIGGLTTGTDYFVIYVDANTISLSTTIRGSAIDLTSTGTGTATLQKKMEFKAIGLRNECTNVTSNSANVYSYSSVEAW